MNHIKEKYDRTEGKATYEQTEGTHSPATDFKLWFAVV
jgi:hypothetical protein